MFVHSDFHKDFQNGINPYVGVLVYVFERKIVMEIKPCTREIGGEQSSKLQK